MSHALSLLLLSCQADLLSAGMADVHCSPVVFHSYIAFKLGFGCLDGPGFWCRASKEADKAVEAAAKEERLRVMQARLAAWQAEQSAQ